MLRLAAQTVCPRRAVALLHRLVGIVGCVFLIDILNVVEFGLGLYIRLRRNDLCESLELIENLGPFVRVTEIEVDRYCFIDVSLTTSVSVNSAAESSSAIR